MVLLPAPRQNLSHFLEGQQEREVINFLCPKTSKQDRTKRDQGGPGSGREGSLRERKAKHRHHGAPQWVGSGMPTSRSPRQVPLSHRKPPAATHHRLFLPFPGTSFPEHSSHGVPQSLLWSVTETYRGQTVHCPLLTLHFPYISWFVSCTYKPHVLGFGAESTLADGAKGCCRNHTMQPLSHK